MTTKSGKGVTLALMVAKKFSGLKKGDMKTMNILMVYPYFIATGGVEKHITELSEHLAGLGHNVIILTCRIDSTLISVYPPEGVEVPISEKELEKIENSPLVYTQLPNYHKLFGFSRGSYLNLLILAHNLSEAIIKVVRKFRIDRLYACEPAAIIASYLAYRKIKKYSANLKLIASLHSSFDIKHKLIFEAMRHILRPFHKVVVTNINENTYNRFCKDFGNKLIFIPNWVNNERFRPRCDHKQTFRRRFGIPEDRVVFLCVTRLVSAKNPLNILKAFHLLIEREARNDLMLLIVGEGNLKSMIGKYIQLFDLHNYIRLLEPIPYVRDEYPLLYNIADVFVFTPFHEGVSMVVLEALGSGLPVIYSDVSGVPKNLLDVIILANPSSIEEIYSKMKTLIEEPTVMKEFKKNSCEAASHFSMSRLLPKLADVILWPYALGPHTLVENKTYLYA